MMPLPLLSIASSITVRNSSAVHPRTPINSNSSLSATGTLPKRGHPRGCPEAVCQPSPGPEGGKKPPAYADGLRRRETASWTALPRTWVDSRIMPVSRCGCNVWLMLRNVIETWRQPITRRVRTAIGKRRIFMCEFYHHRRVMV